MMNEPKAFASLSAGLLARKGMARPAMRRQGAVGLGGLSAPSIGVHDDLGWNDMGFDVNPAAGHAAPSMDLKQLLAGSVLAAEHMSGEDGPVGDGRDDDALVPEIVRQQAELAKRINLENTSNKNNNILKEDSKNYKKGGGEARRAKAAPTRRKRAASAVVHSGTVEVRARDKAAFTLRLDAERHLRLRLASAVRNQSSQAIMTQLLDDFLASVPEIGDLAGRVSAAPPARMKVTR